MICVRLCYVCSTWLSCFCSPIFLIFMYIISWGGFQVHIFIEWLRNLIDTCSEIYSHKWHFTILEREKSLNRGWGLELASSVSTFSLNVRWTFTVNPIVRALSNGWVKTLNVWESWVRLWCILLVIMAKCYNNTHTASGGVQHIMSRQDFFLFLR